jgi:sugar phosphate isomerase/epimerase
MRIACSSWSLRREIPGTLELIHFPAWCGARGIDAVELCESQLPTMKDEYLQDYVRACDDAGVELVCLSVHNDFTLPDGDRLFQEVDRVRHLLYNVAAPMNIPIMRVNLGKADRSSAGDQRALEAYRGLRPDLDATGIMMALENHGRIHYEADELAAIIAGVDSPLFGACIDFAAEPPDLRYLAINELAALAIYAHARGYNFNEFGEETRIDYKQAIATLKEYGYDGILAIEYDGLGDGYQGVLDIKALIEKHWYHPEAGYGRLAA